ncbi:MAG: 3-deoxy-D-manno-octulosonic acid transferase [Alphaproteobacteria bacterium]
MTPALSLYRSATWAATPLAGAYLRRRLAAGKEDPERFAERLGVTNRARPTGPLLWAHAASVGEALSVLPLLERCRAGRARLHVLITTGTVNSARLLAARLDAGMTHQFVPFDLPVAVARFLDHWQPDAAIVVESELWPNLLAATRRRGIPMALVNGRMSERSFSRWRAMPAAARTLLGGFTVVLAQSPRDKKRFERLGARDPLWVGDLKDASPPLAADLAALGALRRAIGDRPAWVAASTHPGEEALCGAVHRRLTARYPTLLTIIVPRHPERGRAVAESLAADGHEVARRCAGEEPSRGIYVADTLGELGVLFRLAEVAFIGGSLVSHGGHNPLEPARLGRPILLGPHMANFSAAAGRLVAAGAAQEVGGAEALADALDRLLGDAGLRARRGEAALAATAAGERVLDRVIEALRPMLAHLSAGHARP